MADYTFTKAYWCDRFIGWAIWTPAGSCIGVFADLATAQRRAAANARMYLMHRWRERIHR